MSHRDKRPFAPEEPSAEALILHDVRGALADILGGLELIDAGALPPRATEQIDRVRSAALQLGRLVGQLEHARAPVEARAPGAGAQSAVLPALLPAILSRWRGRAADQGIAFSHEIDLPPGLAAAISPLALERALNNLIDNALKYGAGAPVSVAASVSGPSVTITVRDEGPVLPAETVSRLMRPGARGGHGEGSGFGLHIARRAIEEAAGSLHLGPSPDGRGMVARIELPVAVAPAAKQLADAPDRARPLEGSHVLVVEDNETNRLVITTMLERLGARWSAAGDGVDGLAALERHPFDVALVDIEMPRMGGLEMLRQIRAHADPRIARLPALAVTAYGLAQHRRSIIEAGGDGVILKPVDDLDAFGVAVARVLPRAVTARRLPALRARLGPEGFGELTRTLEQDLGTCVEGLRNAAREADPGGLRRATHNLVSLAGIVGADRVVHAARGLNLMLHADPLPIREEIGVAANSLIELAGELRSLLEAGLNEEGGR